jgi:hypothetical protein
VATSRTIMSLSTTISCSFFSHCYLVSCLVNDVVLLRSIFSFFFSSRFFSNLIANCCLCCYYYYYYYYFYYYLYCGFLAFSCALRLHIMITAIYMRLCECECVSAILVAHIEQERHDHGKKK